MSREDTRVVHRRLRANGVELHVAEVGSGPPVVLCHGFPELWYSWRHQLPALAAAGYRAVAPDMRGYGQSSIPRDVEAYDLPTVCNDMLGLLDDLDEERAVFAGHDWGASVVWQLALAHPDRVAAVVGMSVPFAPRAPAPPVSLLRAALGEDFYIVWFQQPGVADAALARDPRRTLATTRQWTAQWAEDHEQPPRPDWLTDEDLGLYVGGVRTDRVQRRAQLLPQPRPHLAAHGRSCSAPDRAAGTVHRRLARSGAAVHARRDHGRMGDRSA